MTDPTGEHTTYSYNGLGLLQSVTYPDGSTKSIAYGTDDLPTTVTLPMGETVDYTRDAAGHVVSQQTSGGDASNFTYDANGDMTSSQDAAGTTVYKYDADGNVIEIDNPDGSFLQFKAQPIGRVVRVTAETSSRTTSYVTSYGYDPAGNHHRSSIPSAGRRSSNI